MINLIDVWGLEAAADDEEGWRLLNDHRAESAKSERADKTRTWGLVVNRSLWSFRPHGAQNNLCWARSHTWNLLKTLFIWSPKILSISLWGCGMCRFGTGCSALFCHFYCHLIIDIKLDIITQTLRAAQTHSNTHSHPRPAAIGCCIFL